MWGRTEQSTAQSGKHRKPSWGQSSVVFWGITLTVPQLSLVYVMVEDAVDRVGLGCGNNGFEEEGRQNKWINYPSDIR